MEQFWSWSFRAVDRNKPRSSQKTAPVQLSKILEPPLPNPTPVAKSRMPESLRNAGSPQSPGRARGLGAILGYREITIFGGELAAWARQGRSRERKEGGPSASPAGAGGARQNNFWQPSTSRARQGEHGAKTWAISQAQARAVHRKPQHGRPSAQAGGLAGICSEHVSHGSRVAMEGIHQGKTARRRCRAKVSACVVPRSSCPLDAPRRSCCPAALSASPQSPAPPPLCILHIF